MFGSSVFGFQQNAYSPQAQCPMLPAPCSKRVPCTYNTWDKLANDLHNACKP